MLMKKLDRRKSHSFTFRKEKKAKVRENGVLHTKVQIGKKIQHRIENLFTLPISFNMCFGCSKEPS